MYKRQSINHDSANTKFTHTGSGGLYLGADLFAIQRGNHTENYLTAAADGAVELYHNNSKKLATASSGVDVTGTLSTSGAISVEGAAAAGISEGLLIDYSTNLARFLTYDSSTGSEIAFYTQPNGGSTTERVRIDSSGNFLVGTTSTIPFTLSSGTGCLLYTSPSPRD